LRIPPWVDPEVVLVEGVAGRPVRTGDYLYFSEVVSGQTLQVRYPLADVEITLSPDVHLHPIRVKMRGDEVVAMENFGADLTFFDPLD